MSFHQRSFTHRFDTMGDIAEKVFEQVFPEHSRVGINRPNMRVTDMPAELRYAPDYMTVDSFVEVMGIGRDKTLKVKLEKIMALQHWTAIAPVNFFVYDSNRNKWWIGPAHDWWIAAVTHGEVSHFHDNNKPYLALRSDHFPTEAHDGPPRDPD